MNKFIFFGKVINTPVDTRYRGAAEPRGDTVPGEKIRRITYMPV